MLQGRSFAYIAGIAVVTLASLARPAQAATYYVAPSPEGNDSNPGTSSSPWRTIQKAANNAKAGDTVNVAYGTYNELVDFPESGSSTSGFITFNGVAGGTGSTPQPPIVDGVGKTFSGRDGLFSISSKSYIRIQGFELRNLKTTSSSLVPVGIYVVGSCRNIEILNNKVHNIEVNRPTTTGLAVGNAHGIAVFGTSGTTAITGLVISGNEIYANKLGTSEALVLNGNVDGFAVTDNYLHHNDNIGIDFIGSEGTAPSNDYARNGRCSGNRVEGSSTKSNPMYKEYSSAGIYVDGGRNIVIERNRVTGSDFGIEIASEDPDGSTREVTIRNNFIYKNLLGGIAMGGYDSGRGRTENCHVLNNTLYQNDQATDDGSLGELYVQHFVYNNVIKNNIFYASGANLLIYNPYSDNSGNVIDYNAYYANAGATAGKWRWRNIAYTGWTNWKKTSTSNKSGNDLNGHFTNPSLINPSSGDLHITSSSAMIGKGTTTITGTLLIKDTDLDIDGQSRLQGAIDLGADEVPQGPPPPPPNAPTGLIGTGGQGTASLNWTDNSVNETSFKIERKPALSGSFAQVGTVPADIRIFSESLPPGDYEYRVKASNANGDSGYTNTVTVTVTAPPPPPPPLPPSGLTATGGEGQATLAWTDNSSNETGFKVQRKPADEDDGSFQEIATLPENTRNYTNTGLGAGLYTYRVQSFNSGGGSEWSNSATATVTPSVTPAAPSNLVAATTGGDTVELSWADNSNNEFGFRVERKTGTGAYATVATTTNNTTTYSNTGVPMGQHTYRVIATGTINSAPSNEAMVGIANPTADAYIRSGTSATVKFGTATIIEAKDTPDANTKRKGYARFSLAGVGATVTSAKLRIFGYVKRDPPAAIAKSATVHPVADITWSESTLTWNFPTAGGPVMGSALGPAVPVPFGDPNNNGFGAAYVEFDVTSYIQQRRAANASQVSLGLQSAVISPEGQLIFNSRENTNNKPLLLITSR